MAEPARIAMYSDLHCPYAYVAAYRLRKLRDEYRGRVVVEHKSLALEYVNRRPTPKPILDVEAPTLMLVELTPAPCRGDACLDLYRRMLDEAVGVRRGTMNRQDAKSAKVAKEMTNDE